MRILLDPELDLLLCHPPKGLQPTIVPLTNRNASTARGRCGHIITTRHALVAFPGGPEVRDSIAATELMRNRHGARPLGPIGAVFGWSPHRCDACRRAEQLARTILCTCCGSTIASGYRADVAPIHQVLMLSDRVDLGTLTTTTENHAGAVVCEACIVTKFRSSEPARYVWLGGANLLVPRMLLGVRMEEKAA